jgi:hypothetical protein
MNGLGEVALFLSVDRPRKCVTFSWAVSSWLSGIDCPETGNKAKELVFGKEVTLRCGFRL